MDRKLLSFLFLASLIIALTTPVYAVRVQDDETPNEYRATVNWTTAGNLYDASWTTSSDCACCDCYYYYNYTKHSGALQAYSYVTIKDGNETYTDTTDIIIPSACWPQTPLQFTLKLNSTTGLVLNCTTASGQSTMRTSAFGNISMYEEKVVWAFESDIKDVLQDTGEGMGTLMNEVDTPLGTILIVIGMAVTIPLIFIAIAKGIGKV